MFFDLRMSYTLGFRTLRRKAPRKYYGKSCILGPLARGEGLLGCSAAAGNMPDDILGLKEVLI